MIRQLVKEDAAAYRDIRLEGLKTHPEAFGASYGQESLLPLAHFIERIESAHIFGAFARDGALGGIVGVQPRAGEKYAHAGMIFGMYLRPILRGTGLARPLLQAAMDKGLESCRSLRLTVEAGNARAIGLYQSLGFEEWGLDRQALKVDGRFYDELSMRFDP